MSSHQFYYPTPQPLHQKPTNPAVPSSASSSYCSLLSRCRAVPSSASSASEQRTCDLAVVDGMPPIDHDAMVCGDAFFDDSEEEEEREDPYAPAASLRLRIGEDIDWCDVGGVAVLRRDDSTKGAGANPKSAARRRAAAPRSSMSSAVAQRKVVPVVIGGLPPPAAAGKSRCSPCRLGGRARASAAGEEQGCHHYLEEPGSPKVSCLGAVRPEQRLAGRGETSRRAWWCSRFAARVACCFSSHRSAPSSRDGADD